MRLTVSQMDSSSLGHIEMAREQVAASAQPFAGVRPRFLPSSISRGQAYYWSAMWQESEIEARNEIAAGNGVTFGSAREAIGWLLSDDDCDDS